MKLNPEEIQNSHTHGPDTPRIEMLKGYNQMKERADGYSEESTRLIFAYGVATMGDLSLAKLPNIDSIKEGYVRTRMVLKF